MKSNNGKKMKVGGSNFFVEVVLLCLILFPIYGLAEKRPLRFGKGGSFKILQVADMHYGDGKTTPCEDVFPYQMATCSDLNTTAFIKRMILAEKPDLIVFTGDNIFGYDVTDAAKSLEAAFAPAIASNIPWAAVLGNHDQESALSREGVMKHIVKLKNTLSLVNPVEVHVIDGFGNYNLEVGGVEGSSFENKSVLNLYFLDSGDYSTIPSIPGYGWIKPSQQFWFERTSKRLQRAYMAKPEAQKGPAPGIAYFHIPLPEFSSFDSTNFTGVKQEGISSASVNSGFFTTMVSAGDVKAVFTGHDHLNDFCGELTGIQLCYAGGFGYHAYGKAASLSHTEEKRNPTKSPISSNLIMAERGGAGGERGGFGRGFGGGRSRGDRGRGGRRRGRREEEEKWVPVTKLGRLVHSDKIRSLEQIYLHSLPIKEHQIVDKLCPGLKDEVMKIMPVQKQTRAGQRTRFKAFVVVGDNNGHVGLGVKCSKEVATAIRGAIILAKLSVIPVRRGYWGNKIGKPHTVPCKVTGKCGSVTVRMVPAPRGAGIVAARVPKKVLQFAGIDDVFTSSRGSTKTLGNFVKATFECLLKTYGFLTPDFWRETRFTKSPFQEHTDLLAKPTGKLVLEEPERNDA